MSNKHYNKFKSIGDAIGQRGIKRIEPVKKISVPKPAKDYATTKRK